MRIFKIFSLFACIACLLMGCNDNSNYENQEPQLVLDKTSLSLYEEETYTLTAEMKNYNSRLLSVFSWSSSDENVATVYGGKVTAVGVGTAIITAVTTFKDGYSAQCVVTVTREPGFDYEIGEHNGKIQDDYYRFYIPVKNTGNINICLYSMTYQIQNKYGDELYNSYFSMYAYPSIIAPGETGYFCDYPYNSHGSFRDKTPKDLVVIQHPKIKKAKDYKCERYQVSTAKIEENTYYSSITGTITNNSKERIRKPVIALQLFDKKDNFVYCIASSFQEGIEPGVTKEYSVMIPDYGGDKIAVSEIAKIKPVAYDNVEFEQ